MEIVISIAAKIAEYTIEPIGRQLGYLFYYNSNVANIEEQVENLEDERLRVQHSIDEAKRNGEEIEDDVKKWLGRVDQITAETKKLFQPKMSCPNLKLRYQLSRKAKKIAEDVVEIQKAGKFDRVSYKPALLGITTMASTRDYESLESRISTLHKIMDALRNDDINMIGVYGMGGVGKTTLVKEVARQAQEGKLFDIVAMAVVTHNPNLRKIQEEIADALGLKFDEQSDAGRASRLFNRIKPKEKEEKGKGKEKEKEKEKAKEKAKEKILIILDDLWMELDLNKVGVPFGNDCKGCSILLTSRNLDVLHNQMDCQLNFSIGTLPEEEAWRLFKKMAGDCVENSNLQSIAVEVSKKCSGLPVAIVTVARALRDKSPFEWKNALRQLQKPNVRYVAEMPEAIYSALQLSYNYLKSPELKSIFLLCGLIKNNATIMDLLKYCFGLGFLRGIDTMEEARDRVYTLVQQLKASCLLLNSDSSEWFMMHDVVRDVAISIASRDQHVFTVRNDEKKEWLDKDQLKNCTKISLCYSDMNELPEGLECPSLEFFYMGNKDSSIKVPDNFFQGFCNLKVLDLTCMHFPTLPSSIVRLTNLQTLCLNECELGDDIDLIGELKNLKILSLINSDIKQLPRVIGQLTQLKLLDLSKCSKLVVIPSNVISSLKKLEELYVGDTLHEWEVEGLKNASLSELKHLPNLTALDIQVLDEMVLPKDLYFDKLKSYRISIGDDWKWYSNEETSRILKLKLSTDYHSQDGVKMLLNNVENLYLGELKGVNNVLYELNSEGFLLLKHLHVQKNVEIQHIVNAMDCRVNRPCGAFVVLESLSLSDLTNLENICHGPLTGTSFCKLRSIQVNKCHKLKNFFSASIAKGLLELQEISVQNCCTMEEIIAEGGEEDANNNEAIQTIEFHQLRTLKLVCLPKLIGFYSKVKSSSVSQRRENQLMADTGAKEIISEDELDTPMYLFNKKVALPNLENMEIRFLDNLRMIWHDQLVLNDSLRKLKILTVMFCDSLNSFFPTSVAKHLIQLEKLEISYCEALEDIVTKQEGLEIEPNKFVFPQLTSITLACLCELKSFYPTKYTLECLSLKVLNISICHKVKILFASNLTISLLDTTIQQPLFWIKKVALPNLENMEISSMNNLRMIWHDQFVLNDSFCKLKILKVVSCNSLKSLFPTFEAKHLIQLEKLEISDCDALEDIVIKQEGLEIESNKFVFPQLTSITLARLRELKSFYPTKYTLECPSLKVLNISICNKVKILFASNLTISLLDITIQQPLFWIKKSTKSLKKLTIIDSATNSLFNENVALPNLENMVIAFMDNLRMIWHDQLVVNDSFCRLKKLKVMSCGSLKSLFPTSVAKHLIQLETLVIVACKVLEDIVVKEEGLIETEPNKFEFPKLTSLALGDLPKLKSFYPAKYTLECPSLKVLEIHKCNKVKTLFASDLTISLLDITIQQPLFWIKKVALPNLENMKIEYMDNLRMIWHDQLVLNDSFCKLKILKVMFCGSLKSLFPISVAKHLIQLEKLEISYCKALEDIVIKQEGLEIEPNKFVFPKLTSLELWDLPELKSFYPTKYTLECPSLKVLKIDTCNKVMILFASDLTISLLDITIQQPLFWIKKDTFANLEELDGQLEWNDAMNETWHGQFPAEFFSKLKVLNLSFSYSESAVFAASFVQELYNLQELILSGDLIEEIQPYEGSFLISLRKLVLLDMPKLKHLWKEDSQTGKAFQNLEELSVSFCGGLKNLEPFLIFLQNLKTLKADECNGLINLVTSSAAKTLVQLRKMRIWNCNNITEIVAKEGGEVGDPEIVFSQLKSLELNDLPRLTSFHPGNCTMKFPSLEEVRVNRCPELKIFSQGVLSTPALSTLEIDEYIEFNGEKDDLNNIIKNLEAS